MNNTIIICPNKYKEKILEENKEIINNKFMTKEEFFSNFFYDYNIESIYYILKTYNINIDIVFNIIKYLNYIDINKQYKSNKLNKYKNIKTDLINNKLIKENILFKDYIKDKTIKIIGYYNLEKKEEEILNYKLNYNYNKIDKTINTFDKIEDEIVFVATKIIELIKNNISLNNIYLVNISNDYSYLLKMIFDYFNLPLEIDLKNSIYNTQVIKDYLNNNILDTENNNKSSINKKLINILNKLCNIEKDDYYNQILKYYLKHTYVDYNKYKESIKVVDLEYNFNEKDYVFILGFNQETIPKKYIDNDIIDDNERQELNLYTINELNKRENNKIKYLLSKINNLYISYSKSSIFNSYFISNLVDDLKLKQISNNIKLNYSNKYNKLLLCNLLDEYNLYGTIDDNLKILNNSYDIEYKTYNNSFTSINKKLYLSNQTIPIELSYSKINKYLQCSFKYYITYVLKLDIYEDKFENFIGSLYHKILSLYRDNNFDFNKEFTNYIKTRKTSNLENILLIRLKKELLKLLEQEKNQDNLIIPNNRLNEKELKIQLDNILFTGIIDKIIFDEDKYAIVDYKTGNISDDLKLIKYGMNMQLIVYLYLINKNNLLKDSKFCGIYYQRILFDYNSKTIKFEDETKLNGYTTDNIDRISKFDKTFEDSKLIKSMKYDDTKGFSSKKIFNDIDIENIIKYCEEIILKTSNSILEANFEINPKIYNKNNISCEYCKFKDICFMNNSNLIYLDNVDDFTFIEGDYNG